MERVSIPDAVCKLDTLTIGVSHSGYVSIKVSNTIVPDSDDTIDLYHLMTKETTVNLIEALGQAVVESRK